MDELINLLVKSFGALGPVVIVIVVLAIFILPQAIRILREYERGVIFRLGKLQGAKGPGHHFPDSRRGQHGEDGFARRDH